jgi:hypothetical protein
MSCHTLTDLMSDPIVPRELEARIFELAALLWPRRVPVLMLVARRVRVWCAVCVRSSNPALNEKRTEPILYRTIVYAENQAIADIPFIATERELRAILARDRSVFLHTEYLFVGHWMNKTCARLIHACSRAHDVYFSQPFRVPIPFAGHALTRLRCSVAMLVLRNDQACYNTLTHLSITVDATFCVQFGAWLVQLPRLTHLAMCAWRAFEAEVLQWLPPTLEYLIILGDDDSVPSAAARDGVCRLYMRSREDRGHDWQHGRFQGNDFWWRAYIKNTEGIEPPSLVDWDRVERQCAAEDDAIWAGKPIRLC